ncbi:MAG: flagellar basal body P-ring formation chaperone FlgA [Hyphomicrobiales bacterium]|nr:flagellar basal body P-ring formation chaperone FlgA [Hyphomicrobiales bacterium]
MKTFAVRHNCCFLSLAAWLAAWLLAPATAFAEMRAIPVPAAVVYAGDQIVQGILVDRQFSVPDAAAKNYVLLRRQVEGLYAKRTLLPGKPIPLAYVKLKDSVVQGVLTKATFEMNGLVISTFLIPLQSGVEGELIDARNPEYGRTVKALVKADGSLQVGGL